MKPKIKMPIPNSDPIRNAYWPGDNKVYLQKWKYACPCGEIILLIKIEHKMVDGIGFRNIAKSKPGLILHKGSIGNKYQPWLSHDIYLCRRLCQRSNQKEQTK